MACQWMQGLHGRADIVLAVSVKVLSNCSNHAFGTPVDERFAAYKVD